MIKSCMQRLVLMVLCTLLSMNSFAAELVPAYAAYQLNPTSFSIPETNLLQLRSFLTLYQIAAASDWPPLADKTLSIGKKNINVKKLREKLTALGDLRYNDEDTLFDDVLEDAVKNFQQRHGLDADGVVGKMTRQALNIHPRIRLQQIQMSLERWSQLSKKLGPRYVMVNVPDFQLTLVDGYRVILTMKVIVGKPTRQTPEVLSKITRLVFNPYWNVPKKIVARDIVPKVQADPHYLSDNNIRIFTSEENNAREIDDNDINWDTVQENGISYHFRQDPGETNSLGLIKFEFPNPFDVYLHDTPVKELFNQPVRDFSSGCIRLEKPFELVDYLMQDDPAWNEEKMDDILASGKTTYIRIKKPIQVIITYITAWVDEIGHLQLRDDIYGRDPGSED